MGRLDAAAAREGLEELRRGRAGVIVITDGARDLRLTAGADEVSLEAAGHVLQGGEPRDLVRELLCALFWDDPTCLVETPRPGPARDDLSVIRVQEQADVLLGELARGVKELSELQRRVRGLDALVAVKGEPPDGPDDGEPDAPHRLLFAALAPHGERGECLSAVVDQLPLDPLDTAWAVADLLDAERAVVRATPLPALLRRLRQIEPLSEGGLVPGLRRLHAARLLVRVDRRRAATQHRLAADELLGGTRPAAAVEALETCLQLSPDDLPARELLVTCLERDLRHAEARPMREELLELYRRCQQPARARVHLEALDQGQPEQKLAQLELALAMRDFAGADELAGRWAAAFPPERRAQLPFSFAQAGAPEASVAAAATLAGFGGRRRVRLLLWGLTALLLAGAGVAAAEVQARLGFQRAAGLAHGDLVAGAWEQARGRWGDLAAEGAALRVERWPEPARGWTCLSRVSAELAGVDALEADARLVATQGAELDWRRQRDTRLARARLERLGEQARSPALRERVRRALLELDAYRHEVSERVQRLQGLVTSSRLDLALALGRQLREEHPDARDLWEGASVPLRVQVRPQDGARLSLNGQTLPPVDRAEWEVQVPLDGEHGPVVRAEADHALPRQRQLRLSDELVEPVVYLRMFTIARLGRGEPPRRGNEPGVFADEDEPELAAVAQALGADGLVRPDLVAQLIPLLPPLEGTGLRLSVWVRSEARLRRLTLTGLELYLYDPQRGRSAEPRRIDLGRVARPIQHDADGSWRLAGLECLGEDDLSYLGEALRETVRTMSGEVEGR